MQFEKRTLPRRDFIQSTLTAALVLSWLIPARRLSHSLDLTPFVLPEYEEFTRFNMRQPFAQLSTVDPVWSEAFRFATDSRICVRVPINTGDLIDKEQTKLPPAGGLEWTHDMGIQGRWLPWPKANYLMANDSNCPVCDGTGDANRRPVNCEECGEWGCDECYGNGLKPQNLCPNCNGEAIGRFPAIQKIETGYIASHYHEMVAKNLSGVQYFVPDRPAEEDQFWHGQSNIVSPEHVVKFRFDGGLGLLCPLETKVVMDNL